MKTIAKLLLLIAALAAQGQGLDASAQPAWLAQPFRADWNLSPLAEVLGSVRAAAGVVLDATPAAQARIAEGRVMLSDAQPSTLGATLARLERIEHLRFSAGAGVLRVEVPSEYGQRLAAWRIYPFDAQVTIEPIEDQPAEELGLESRRWYAGAQVHRPGNARDFGSTKREERLEPSEMIDYVQQRLKPCDDVGEFLSFEERQDNQLFVLATPDLQAEIAALLHEVYALGTRQRSFRAIFGMLPAGTPLVSGVVSGSVAEAVIAQLSASQTLLTTGFTDQTVHAAARLDHVITDGAEFLSHSLVPALHTVRLGRSVETRWYAGETLTLLHFALAWVEDAGPGETSELRVPERRVPAPVPSGTATRAPATPVQPSPGTAAPPPPAPGPPAPAAQPSASGGDGSRTAPLPATPFPAQRLTLTLPVLWSWRPAGDCYLRPGEALVLASEHAGGQAVIVVVAAP